MKNFFDDAHAHNRLQRCLIGVKNRKGAWRVAEVARAFKDHIITNEGLEYKLQDPDVMITPERLGYVNGVHQCCYISRTTKRMWKAGICRENLAMQWLYPRYRHVGEDMQLTTLLRKLFNGKYPSFEDCLKRVVDGEKAARAFSYNMCIGRAEEHKNPVIYYKNKPMAFIEDGHIIMGDSNSHLLEQLKAHTDMEIWM